MNTEQELDLAADMIKRDAPSQGIDFEDPANAYTVWTPFRTACSSAETVGHWMKHIRWRATISA
jgi:hypothetical protein